jgi:hypothetical protein
MNRLQVLSNNEKGVTETVTAEYNELNKVNKELKAEYDQLKKDIEGDNSLAQFKQLKLNNENFIQQIREIQERNNKLQDNDARLTSKNEELKANIKDHHTKYLRIKKERDEGTTRCSKLHTELLELHGIKTLEVNNYKEQYMKQLDVRTIQDSNMIPDKVGYYFTFIVDPDRPIWPTIKSFEQVNARIDKKDNLSGIIIRGEVDTSPLPISFRKMEIYAIQHARRFVANREVPGSTEMGEDDHQSELQTAYFEVSRSTMAATVVIDFGNRLVKPVTHEIHHNQQPTNFVQSNEENESISNESSSTDRMERDEAQEEQEIHDKRIMQQENEARDQNQSYIAPLQRESRLTPKTTGSDHRSYQSNSEPETRVPQNYGPSTSRIIPGQQCHLQMPANSWQTLMPTRTIVTQGNQNRGNPRQQNPGGYNYQEQQRYNYQEQQRYNYQEQQQITSGFHQNEQYNYEQPQYKRLKFSANPPRLVQRLRKKLNKTQEKLTNANLANSNRRGYNRYHK